MKQNDLYTVLHTDVRTLLHRICFALCPPRVHWSTEDHGSDRGQCNPASVENISGSWNSGILWGNSVFFTNSPTWGHNAGPEGSADVYSPPEYSD